MVWVPGLKMDTLLLSDPEKSPSKVVSRPVTTPESVVIMPSSRLLLSEPLEKFSEPTNALAVE